MKFKSDKDEKYLKEIINDYTSTSGMNVNACKIDNSEIVKCIKCSELRKEYKFCNLVHELSSTENNNKDICTNDDCKNTCLYGSLQAEKLGKEYIYFCPFGLVKWTVPILVDGEMNYFLSGGPVLMHSIDDLLIEDVISKNKKLEPKVDEVKKYLQEFEVVNTKRVRHLARVLRMLAESLMTDENLRRVREKMKINEDNAAVAEFVGDFKEKNDEYLYPLNKEKKLISKIKIGDKDESRKILNEILAYIYSKENKGFQMTKVRIIELIGVLSRTAVDVGADLEIIFGLEYEYLEKINQVKQIDKLSIWLTKIVERFIECTISIKNVKNRDLIYKSMDYIRNNYSNNISLKEVAHQVGLSPNYLSSLFKEEVGMTYNTYLNRVRIENSKNLLKKGYSLVKVAHMVGFNDQSYYSKVFKKIEKTSPGKWQTGQKINIYRG
ncbi:PocR ligand-binding domain-containing protein [Halanaerobium hydrogeniformans]|uniref:Transcriptional regulator, AraC family n=1 Tax=Halanaerobium hydrogeniformans TaxID=656519 RepID=E4RMD0_HALHG|nr:PocR ligand-binding domain-containing protein [Halanaerobium hydrogeniformans]ADQ14461.1 transcriptional regulator, AraC family [Halanaerobium hydrogeniformans]